MPEDNTQAAMLLTLGGAMATGLGGLVSVCVCQPPSEREHSHGDARLAVISSFSAGVMLFISFSDLVRACQLHAVWSLTIPRKMPEALDALDFDLAWTSFFAGIVIFAVITLLCTPESAQLQRIYLKLAGAPTTSSPGPEPRSPLERSHGGGNRRRLMLIRSGLVTALGIAFHNAPEGVAVYLASMRDLKIGGRLAVAIAMHNIPEGASVAAPVFAATGNRVLAVALAFLSGSVEFCAVLVCIMVGPEEISPAALDVALGAVAGIMVFIAFHELLPLSYEEDYRVAAKEDAAGGAGGGLSRTTLVMFAGMAACFASLHLMREA